MPKATSKTISGSKSNSSITPSSDELLLENTALKGQVQHLQNQLDLLKRHIFGHRTEKLPPALLNASFDLFGQEILVAAPAAVHVPAHERTPRPKGHGRAELPDNLPCEEIVLDVPEEEKTCPCCGKDRICIGQDSRDELDIIPPQFIKRRFLRPKYACRSCTEYGVAQAAPAPCVIDKGIPSARLVVWILLAKYMDHLPLYRIMSQFKRWGVDLSDTTMIGWISSVFDLLGPIHRALEHEIRTCGCMHLDETTLRVQRGEKDTLGVGKTSTDFLWAMLGRGPDGTPVGVSFRDVDNRKHATAVELLEGVTGIVVTDGYQAYETACEGNKAIVHAGCWAHVRRKFHEARLGNETAADKPLKMISHLYKAQQRINTLVVGLKTRWTRMGLTLSQEAIDAIVGNRRQKWMKRWVDKMVQWNETERMSALPKDKIAGAITYFGNQLPKLEQFLTHARVDLDNNIIERAIRPIAIGRKNWLFAGSDNGAERAALIMSIVGTCRMLDIDPGVYLCDVLLKVRSRGKKPEDCADLTPLKWKSARNLVG